jgi:hypothetical protein
MIKRLKLWYWKWKYRRVCNDQERDLVAIMRHGDVREIRETAESLREAVNSHSTKNEMQWLLDAADRMDREAEQFVLSRVFRRDR